MKLVVLLVLLLAGCSTPPTEVPSWVGKHKNACLPEAIALVSGLKQADIQAKVLNIYTNKWGHSVAVYLYPAGHNRLWVWDSHWQSVNLRAWYNDPYSVANAWLKWTHSDVELNDAEFLQ